MKIRTLTDLPYAEKWHPRGAEIDVDSATARILVREKRAEYVSDDKAEKPKK